MSKNQNRNAQKLNSSANEHDKELEKLRTIHLVGEKFRAEYAASDHPSVLVAYHEFLSMAEADKYTPAELRAIVENDSQFKTLLAIAETSFRNRKDQKIDNRLDNLDKNTHWKINAINSLSTGVILGLVFAAAGPFFGTLLQPTADELLGRKPAPATSAVPSTMDSHNVTTNYYISEPLSQSALPPAKDNEPDTRRANERLACRTESLASFAGSVKELALRNNVVTAQLIGNRVSICYRPTGISGTALKALGR